MCRSLPRKARIQDGRKGKVGQSKVGRNRAGQGSAGKFWAGQGSCIPEDEANGGASFIATKGREVDEQDFAAYMLGDCICHHGFAHPTGPMKQQNQAPSAPHCSTTGKCFAGFKHCSLEEQDEEVCNIHLSRVPLSLQLSVTLSDASVHRLQFPTWSLGPVAGSHLSLT